jgi:methyltransferase (TIGR00027 family)
MLPGQPSRTLLRAAIRRAQHQIIDRPLILHDPVVLDLVPEAREPDILTEFGDSGEMLPALFRALFAMRSRFTEDRLGQAAERGVRQYVMIGAGLDTFPWRQPDFARDMRIFAADHPASLIWLHRRLRERNVSRPSNLTYAPVDLEEQRLGPQLTACGFDGDATSFCSLLGVSQYLSSGALGSLLSFVASLNPGSELVLSFAPPEGELAGLDLDAAARSEARTTELGEPWKTRLSARELVDWLVRLGFSNVCHLSPERAQARYFAGRQDGLRVPHWEQLIAATV